MDLNKLQLQTDELKSIDVSSLSMDKLSELVDKLDQILEQGETSLLSIKVDENE